MAIPVRSQLISQTRDAQLFQPHDLAFKITGAVDVRQHNRGD
jgi:hypothetical protein